MACHKDSETEFLQSMIKKLRKRMISRHLCSTGQRFKQTYEKDFKTSKKRLEKKLRWT